MLILKGRGYSDILHIRRFGQFLGFKILNFNTLGDFQKNEYVFFWYEDFVDIFMGSSPNWTGYRGHFCAF